MPYISQDKRRFAHIDPLTAGELNYAITLLIKQYAFERLEGLNYQTINDVMGALEGAKAEFYRRVVVPYEDAKIEANGDVY
jgi:hypothetical protein